MKFYDVEQNTDAWLELRMKKPTSSKLGVIMANYGKAFGEPAKKYAVEIALERITGSSSKDGFSNQHMDRGHEEEPLARMAYEEEMFCFVKNGGFFDHGHFGCSPDGLVGDDGLIEIKSAIPSVHYDRIRKQSFDSAYKWQLIGNMKFASREWIDFISFCSSFPDEKKLFIYRLTASNYKEEFEMIDKRLSEFWSLINSIESDIRDKSCFLFDSEKSTAASEKLASNF